MKTKEQLKSLEEGILMASYGTNEMSIEELKRMVRFVFDENGEIIEKLPGIGTLEESGLETYKKQFRAAMKGPFARFFRRVLGNRDIGETRQEMLNHSHALKQELGKDWKRFYANLLIGKNNQGLLMHLAEQGIIDESYIEDITKRTGWVFNRHPIPIYEVEVHQRTKQALSNDGGLYKIILEIRPDEFATVFAKKHGKRDEYERTLKVQPLLAEITEKVSPIIAKDEYNNITIEPYINGETLTQRLRRTSMNTENPFVKDPVEREKQTRQTIELNDQNKKDMLIPALDELIDISNAVEKNRELFSGLRALGKDGRSFTDWFKEKYNTNDADLIALVEKNITSYLDSEDTVFCHGDAHTDNVIEQLHKPYWIDWEFAGFSIPQWDVVKFLKKAGLSEEAEADVVAHVGKKRKYRDKERFNIVYNKAKIFDRLASAAKYHQLSLDSRLHSEERQAQADVYFTDALDLIEADKTISEEDRFRLSGALEKDAKGRLSRLAREEYEKIAKEIDPYTSQSMENFGTPSIMEKYSRPPLRERLGKMWKKHKLKAAAGIALIAASVVGKFVYADVKAEQARELTKIQRTSQYYSDIDRNDKLMPFVSKYADKYDNVNERELSAVINAAFQYNKRIADDLLDYKKNPEPWARDAGVKKKKEMFKLKNGLSEKQAFVKEEHLEDPENNVFAAAKRLSDMKKLFPELEDTILAFYTSPELVQKWKEKADSYWDYSKEKEFEWDTAFKYSYRILTDRAIAYLKK